MSTPSSGYVPSLCMVGIAADVLAHPVKQACLVSRGLIAAPVGGYGGRLYQAVEGKFNVHEGTGRIDGYGRVWLSCT